MLFNDEHVVVVVEKDCRKTYRALIELHRNDLLSRSKFYSRWLSAEYFEHDRIRFILRFMEPINFLLSSSLLARLVFSSLNEFPKVLHECFVKSFNHQNDIHVFGGTKLETL